MLREYQKHAIAKTYKSLRQHDRTMLQLPTGSGKTHVAMEIIKHGLKHDRRVNFCVDRLTLLDQTLDRFIMEGIDVGVVQGGHPLFRPQAPVQIVSLQTLQRRHRSAWPPANLFIFDEAHTHYGIISKVMDTWNALKYVGLSATPFTRGLGRHWHDLVVGATTEELIMDGYLSKYVAYGPSSPDMRGVRHTNGDYNVRDLEERMNFITGDIISHFQNHAGTKKTIVFTPTVAYAEHMAEQFQNLGVSSGVVHGRDSDETRRDTLDAFKTGDIQVLCNCEVLIKGYDQPDIEVGIIARPTRSLSLHIQMLGRLLRTAPGKDRAIILDHAGNIARLGFPDDPLPNQLCTRERGVSSVDRRQDDPEPWNCSRCHTLVPPRTHQCPTCGYIPRRRPELEVVDEKLSKLRKIGMVEKQTVYSQLLHYAEQHGYADGWVAHKYRAIFGVWPRKVRHRTEPPSESLVNWIRSQNIRYANRRQP